MVAAAPPSKNPAFDNLNLVLSVLVL